MGVHSEHIDISLRREEADTTIPVQHAITSCKRENVQVISDDTDIFILLLHFMPSNRALVPCTCTHFQQSTGALYMYSLPTEHWYPVHVLTSNRALVPCACPHFQQSTGALYMSSLPTEHWCPVHVLTSNRALVPCTCTHFQQSTGALYMYSLTTVHLCHTCFNWGSHLQLNTSND